MLRTFDCPVGWQQAVHAVAEQLGHRPVTACAVCAMRADHTAAFLSIANRTVRIRNDDMSLASLWSTISIVDRVVIDKV
jgi:hypothetical protein